MVPLTVRQVKHLLATLLTPPVRPRRPLARLLLAPITGTPAPLSW